MAGQTIGRVAFAGGGTGGHVYMGVALGRELLRRNSSAEILFVGTRRGMESRIIPGTSFRLETIRLGGLNRVSLRTALQTLFQLPASLWASRRILKRFQPDIVVGLGGYSSGPVVLCAHWMGLPTLAIEPNAYPGFANRRLASRVDAAAVAFQETCKFFGEKCRVTGIPVRKEFFQIRSAPAAEGPLRILLFGGSQGSRPLNRLMREALNFLEPEKFRICHQAGKFDTEAVRTAYQQGGFKAEVQEFIDDMPRRFDWADLIVSRSGASSVAELAAAGKASILIPFPQAADDHQTRNAEAMASKGAAVLLVQEEIDGRKLAECISGLERDRPRLRKIAVSSRTLARPDSTEQILELMEELIERSR